MSIHWEARYRSGHEQRYPWDCVVSFVFRMAPQNVPRKDVRILEVGFGTGANLLFAAREGFGVAGVEISSAAVEKTRVKFASEKLEGDLRQGSFTTLPFNDAQFDLIIDRGALTCVPLSDIARAISEIARCAKPNAHFFFNPYADSHSSSRSGRSLPGNARVDIIEGSLAGLDCVAFLSSSEVTKLLEVEWQIMSMQRLELLDMVTPKMEMHSEWRVVARRQAAGDTA